ncbi:MAG TPA: tripartite tricarboxylate transporter TctB family protein [Symbiobacteriaceae bacterium]|jgi:putative tricarboxylic transport membrane protein
MSLNREQKVAVGLAAFAIIYMVGAWRLPRFSLGTTVVDSYLFPLVIGAILLGLSAIYFFVAKKADPATANKPLFEGIDLKVVGKLAGASLVYALLLEFLGFVVATTFFLVLTMWMLGQKGLWKLFAVSAGFSVVVYLVFVKVLNVPLAEGVLKYLPF